MAFVRIERVPVQVFKLGYLGFTHLQVVFQQDSLTSVPVPQEEWFVIEGLRNVTPDGLRLGVLGDSGKLPMWITEGGLRGDELEAEAGTPESRASRIIASTDAQEAWNAMAARAREIADNGFVYTAYGTPNSYAPTLNSSSLIASLLHAAGLDVQSNLPQPLGYSPGTTTLLGTTEDDHLAIVGNFNAVFGGYGSDLLQGTDDPNRVDRMYGGADNDFFSWSRGVNYIHGGDLLWDYNEDGKDTVFYRGTGNVHIEIASKDVEHTAPQYIATHTLGIDYLFSIERLVWEDNSSDNITTGPGLELIIVPLSILFGGEGEGASTGDPGDTLDLSQNTTGLNVTRANSTSHFIAADSQQGEGGLWVESVEWLVGTESDDKIFGGEGLRGIEGGAGDDLIDTRLVEAFSGRSPEGFDVEITGGEGADTIVANAGRTHIDGGEGGDRIIVSSISGPDGRVEVTIENADSEDSLYIPYNYFNESGEGYENSQLMQIAGAIGTYDNLVGDRWELIYEHRYEEDWWGNTDEIAGVIRFAGSFSFRMEDADLLITIYQNEGVTEVFEIDDAGNTETRTSSLSIAETETIIRVIGFDEGDLGLKFLDPGEFFITQFNGEDVSSYPNWNSSVDELNPDMLAPLETPPVVPDSDPNDPSAAPSTREDHDGTADDDAIAISGPGNIDAGDGNDTVTASGNHDDIIDGGSGADTMAGGAGNDAYLVDNAGDAIVELAGEGYDRVTASIDYTLPGEVEALRLASNAASGTGNALANSITGNDGANTLLGLGGEDELAGGLGDDVLSGGTGSDTYVYARGDGFDTISDSGNAADDVDVLMLTQGIRPSDIIAYRLDSAPDDLLLTFAGGGQVTISGHFATTGGGIEQITFDDGTRWSRETVDALAAAATATGMRPPDANDDSGLTYGGVDNLLIADPLLENDSDPAGGALTLTAVSDFSVGSGSVTADGRIALDLPAGYQGLLTFRYTVANAGGATASATAEIRIVSNAAPITNGTIADQSADAGVAWTYTLSTGLFSDPDGDILTHFARLADGSPLPAWLSFNSNTRTLTGTPPQGFAPLDIVIEAYDGFVLAETGFTLSPGGAVDPDQIFASTSADETLTGGSGNDTFTILGNATGFDIFIGNGGTDTISGSAWNDTIGLANATGNLAGIEIIDGGTGTDTIRLTTGNDTLDLSGITVTGIELVDAQAGNDVITGSAGNDVIRGNAGDDIIAGGAGDDLFTILGGAEGFDRFDGGDGFDTILGSPWNDVIALANAPGNLSGVEMIDGGTGTDTIRLTTGNDTLDLSGITVTGIELVDAQAGNDVITGSAGNDVIRGNAGDDIIAGGAGDDLFTILGGAEGFDRFDGGDGFDTILGSPWNDVIALANAPGNLSGVEMIDGGTGTDTIRLTTGNDTLDLSGITVTGIELVDAQAGNDVLTASAANDILKGGTGQDTFVFKTGFFSPGFGHDRIVDFEIGTPASHDVIDFSQAGFADFASVLAAASDTLDGVVIDAGNSSLTLTGITIAGLTADHFLIA